MKSMASAMRSGAAAGLIALTWGCASSGKIPVADAHAPTTAAIVETVREEAFDPSPWPDAPLDTLIAIAHDVPASLMEGRAAEGTRAEAPGFRVQIFSSLERNAAVEAQENVQAWWRKQRDEGAIPEDIFPDGLPVYSVYSQPYYRIRIGDFSSPGEARTVHGILARRFTDAFVVPDTIVITR